MMERGSVVANDCSCCNAAILCNAWVHPGSHEGMQKASCLPKWVLFLETAWECPVGATGSSALLDLKDVGAALCKPKMNWLGTAVPREETKERQSWGGGKCLNQRFLVHWFVPQGKSSRSLCCMQVGLCWEADWDCHPLPACELYAVIRDFPLLRNWWAHP